MEYGGSNLPGRILTKRYWWSSCFTFCNIIWYCFTCIMHAIFCTCLLCDVGRGISNTQVVAIWSNSFYFFWSQKKNRAGSSMDSLCFNGRRQKQSPAQPLAIPPGPTISRDNDPTSLLLSEPEEELWRVQYGFLVFQRDVKKRSSAQPLPIPPGSIVYTSVNGKQGVNFRW